MMIRSSLMKLFRTKSVDYLKFFPYSGQKTSQQIPLDHLLETGLQTSWFTSLWGFFFYFWSRRPPGPQNQYSCVNFTLTHADWCQLFSVYCRLTAHGSAFKGHKCQDTNKYQPLASSDTQNTDNNQKFYWHLPSYCRKPYKLVCIWSDLLRGFLSRDSLHIWVPGRNADKRGLKVFTMTNTTSVNEDVGLIIRNI